MASLNVEKGSLLLLEEQRDERLTFGEDYIRALSDVQVVQVVKHSLNTVDVQLLDSTKSLELEYRKYYKSTGYLYGRKKGQKKYRVHSYSEKSYQFHLREYKRQQDRLKLTESLELLISQLKENSKQAFPPDRISRYLSALLILEKHDH